MLDKIYTSIRKACSILFLLSKLEIAALFCIALFGAILRIYFLNQPMRFDESATFLHYVNGNWASLLNYSAPNNHLLNTILIKLTTSIWGGHPEIIRLPALAFGILSIILIFMVCRIMGSPGWFAAILVACHPYLILFSANARGYSALVFLTLLFLYQGLLFLQYGRFWAPRILGLIGAIGLFNLPIMLFPIVGITLWLSIQLHKKEKSIPHLTKSFYWPFFLYGFTACVALYTPVIVVTSLLNNGINSAFQLVFNNEFISAGNSAFFFSTINSYTQNLVRIYSQQLSISCILITLGLILICMYKDFTTKDRCATELLVTVVFATILIFIAKHTFPYPRTWIFMIPIVAIVADRGFGYLVDSIKGYSKLIYLILPFSLVFFTPTLLNPNRMSAYTDTGFFIDAPAVAKNIHYFLNDEDSLLAPIIPSNLPVYFYLWHEKKYNPKRKQSDQTAHTYLLLPSNEIRLEMYSHSPHPIDITMPEYALGRSEEVFSFNGTILYRLKN